MIITIFACFTICLIIGCLVPYGYTALKAKLLFQTEVIKNESQKSESKILYLIFILLLPLILFYEGQKNELSLFLLVFGLLAYSDLITRWLPDPLVYILVGLAVYSIDKNNLILPLLSIILYVVPLIILNIIGWWRCKKVMVAAGDFYVLVAVGAIIPPVYAMSLMLLTILFSLFFSRYTKEVPLITVAYMVITGYELCQNYGVLGLN